MTGFHPPRRHHRARMALRLWWHRQQRPTAASASTIPVVVRPRFTAAVWLFGAFLGLCGALAYGIHTSAALGWHDLEGAGSFALCGVGIVAALILEFPALLRGFR